MSKKKKSSNNVSNEAYLNKAKPKSYIETRLFLNKINKDEKFYKAKPLLYSKNKPQFTNNMLYKKNKDEKYSATRDEVPFQQHKHKKIINKLSKDTLYNSNIITTPLAKNLDLFHKKNLYKQRKINFKQVPYII